MFYIEYCDIFKNSFLIERLWWLNLYTELLSITSIEVVFLKLTALKI